ncbi:MAG: isoaspartyl peptidase/L-asparaginase [Actinomycetota bacterium]|nr:isoaspartyl peptidase/L-asparaginase [Actinomycetota bacterium]
MTRGLEFGSALDIVEQAVRVLEDDPATNAGYGAVLNLEGVVELDAGIADGTTGYFGGVANVTVRNPISLARRVLEDTPHVLMTGAGAIALGADMEQAQIAEPQKERWLAARGTGALDPERFGSPEHVDTVGAVGLDARGRLAAGSSTGGVFGKMPGRVGDSPICGAGTYASEMVAVVGTGIGEHFIEMLAAARVARLVEHGDHPQRACEEVVAYVQSRQAAEAGLLALDRRGRVGAAYCGSAWSVAGPEGPIRAARFR